MRGIYKRRALAPCNFFFQKIRYFHLFWCKVNQLKVIVIGGGLAGLSTATHLVDNGITGICVLEAKNNLGGRIRTVALNGSPLELGAQWIHGACAANSVFNLANK